MPAPSTNTVVEPDCYRMAVPGVTAHFFDKSGHWPQWDQAERFHRIVADFLNSPD